MNHLTVRPLATVESEAEHPTKESISLTGRIITLAVVIIPFLGLVAASMLLWGTGFSWVELSLFLSMYLVTIVGVGVGFHRHFTHRSFETNRVVQAILAVLGSMAVQGSLLQWVAWHRRHHQHSDTPPRSAFAPSSRPRHPWNA